jgi:hypothetical protein
MTWKIKIDGTNAYYLKLNEFQTKMETKRRKIIMEQQQNTLEEYND